MATFFSFKDSSKKLVPAKVALLTIFSILYLPSKSIAGTFNIPVNPGGQVTVSANGSRPGDFVFFTTSAADGSENDEDGERNGIFQVKIPNQDKIDEIKVRTEITIIGINIPIEITLVTNILPEDNLENLEPLELPLFEPNDPLNDLVQYIPDLEEFLNDDISFNSGDLINVDSGNINETSNIQFFDGSTLPEDPLDAFDFLSVPGSIESLTPFSGTIAQNSTLEVSPIPETQPLNTLSALVLFGLGFSTFLKYKSDSNKI